MKTLTKAQLKYLIWYMPYWAGYFHELHVAKWERRQQSDNC